MMRLPGPLVRALVASARVLDAWNLYPRFMTANDPMYASLFLANLGSAGQGLNLGVIRGTINIPGLGTIQNLAFLARALETQINANILSTPTLLTLDNEEARIVVGQNVPFVTGQYAQTGSTTTVQPFQTIERRDIGLVLRVKPQITEGGTVRLVLYQEVSRIQDQSIATGIILSKRSLESSVVVDDAQIVVLGGLIEDRLTDGTDKVPIAGDVPVVGQLFRYDARRREKTNLMIFLKPTIVRSGADGRDFTSERYQYLQGEQQRMNPGERAFWNDPAVPTLPPEGKMPGQPGATTPGPATPPPPIPDKLPIAESPPVAAICVYFCSHSFFLAAASSTTCMAFQTFIDKPKVPS